jgi:hypothetical protein
MVARATGKNAMAATARMLANVEVFRASRGRELMALLVFGAV